MGIAYVARAVAAFGIIPVVIGFIIFFVLWTRKSENETRNHYRSLLDEHRSESKNRNEEMMRMLVNTHSSINSVKEQTSTVHSKEEEKEATRINIFIQQTLTKLAIDVNANHSLYVTFHNGGRGSDGRYFQRMSISHEYVDRYTLPIMGELQNFPRTYLPITMQELELFGQRYVSDVEKIKESDINAYNLCSPRGVKSFMVQAVKTADKKMLGFIVLEWTTMTDTSGRAVQRKLRDAAVKISGAIEVTAKPIILP